ncbi:MAG: phosphotransferase [Fimbriimonadaceae bacterium]|nr:phosphotransferase [Fimbriimonadaceae bacterium]
MTVREIARQFDIGTISTVEPFEGPGNINRDVYRVVADGTFLLQRLNTDVFPYPERVMRNAQMWAEGTEAWIRANPDTEWHPLRFAFTPEGSIAVKVDGDVWRMMHFIRAGYSYRALNESVEPLRLAYSHGYGVGITRNIGSALPTANVAVALPGYRNTRLYWDQLMTVMGDDASFLWREETEIMAAAARFFRFDPSVRDRRAVEIRDVIDWIIAEHPTIRAHSRLNVMPEFAMEVTHGDTKLENFLFRPRTLDCVAVLDLDTVGVADPAADFGDALRSSANPVGERGDLTGVTVDRRVLTEFTRGYRTAVGRISEAEARSLATAPYAMAWEQCLRFATDYLRGDTYYTLSPEDKPDLNAHRAIVQRRLAEQLFSHRELLVDLLTADRSG